MTRIEIGHHLVADTRVCGGRMIFKGTRVLVADALELLKAGLTPEQVAEEYRGLVTPKAVREALVLLSSYDAPGCDRSKLVAKWDALSGRI